MADASFHVWWPIFDRCQDLGNFRRCPLCGNTDKRTHRHWSCQGQGILSERVDFARLEISMPEWKRTTPLVLFLLLWGCAGLVLVRYAGALASKKDRQSPAIPMVDMLFIQTPMAVQEFAYAIS